MFGLDIVIGTVVSKLLNSDTMQKTIPGMKQTKLEFISSKTNNFGTSAIGIGTYLLTSTQYETIGAICILVSLSTIFVRDTIISVLKEIRALRSGDTDG